MRKGNDTPSEPLPAVLCWWDVSCFFKHRLQNKSHVVSSSAEGNDCGLAGNAAWEYGMNVAVKHATLRCYGPGRALILLLIMPFGVVDSQRPRQGVKTAGMWSFPQTIEDHCTFWFCFLAKPVGALLAQKNGRSYCRLSSYHDQYTFRVMWRLIVAVILIWIGAKDNTGWCSKRGDQVGQTLAWSNCGLNCAATDSMLRLRILNCKLMYEMCLKVVKAILEKDSWQ